MHDAVAWPPIVMLRRFRHRHLLPLWTTVGRSCIKEGIPLARHGKNDRVLGFASPARLE